jgi:hypothetical protein
MLYYSASNTKVMPMTTPITPTMTNAVPDNLSDELAPSFQENARVAASTAALMAELGMPFEMTEEDEKLAHELFKQVDSKKKPNSPQASYNPPNLYQGNVALKLSALLNEYDHRVILDATQARTYITNRLLEISSCGDAKQELRAIELLGKLSDVGAFAEKSEITITHRTSDDLKNVIADKIQKLLLQQQNKTIDITPDDSLERELGLIEDVEVTDVDTLLQDGDETE